MLIKGQVLFLQVHHSDGGVGIELAEVSDFLASVAV